MTNKQKYVTEADFYAGFGPLARKTLVEWKNRIIQFGDLENAQTTYDTCNQDLLSGNVIMFFDHHYAFDALPTGLALVEKLLYACDILIPYAIHLDMGLGREGEFSLRYKLRTSAYHWLVRNLTREVPGLNFMPVSREFEMNNPRMRKIIDENYSGINTAYLRAFARNFAENKVGQVCFLTPFSGIAFPGKPILHPQIYRSIRIVQSKCDEEIPFYFVGAYPSWAAYQRYYAPLLIPHSIVMRGPFFLPTQSYDQALAVTTAELADLRQAANFTAPDYDRILLK